MRTLILIFVAVLPYTSLTGQDAFLHERMTRLWQLKEGLHTPESVLYYPTENVLYVSSVNENPWKKDHNGFISKISTDGKILKLRWASGLSAPKGMGISNGKLYVTNITEVAEINLNNGVILKRFTNPKAQNLNDIAVGADGTVYVSDSKGDCIFYIRDGKLEILSESPEVGKSNGLFVKNDMLLLGQQNRIAALNLKTYQTSTYIDNTGSIDGIESVGVNTVIFSDWAGHIYIVEPGKEKMLLSDTTPLKINAADIGYNKSEGIIYVPTFFDNAVVAYKLD